jgi:hypothetical protein
MAVHADPHHRIAHRIVHRIVTPKNSGGSREPQR